ncbi:MAG: ShlB/FhaC/HecB family hemolysin secretion/activation protein [Myxococcales bacterium]|nr:ShlB/FhaC/HecB family hemolysin secretion/activation protein [Myxococcales bacterium]
MRFRTQRRWTGESLWIAAWVLLCAWTASAQDVLPGQDRPELPSYSEPELESQVLQLPLVPRFEPPPITPGDVLPPLPLAEGEDTDGLRGGSLVTLTEIRVLGNTVLLQETLDTVRRPYLGRELGFEELQELRDALTAAYVERGYVTSGAVVRSQSLTDGVLEVWIIEGRLTEIQVHTDGRLHRSYVERRIASMAEAIVNVNDLERRLRVLQQDERIQALEASLLPGQQRGEAVLRVRVIEARPYYARFRGNNYSSPVIGSGRGEILLGWNDVSGGGDAMQVEYKGGVGLQDVQVRYEVPLNAYDTRFGLHLRRTWTDVVEAPFDDFGIKGETATYGFSLRHPFYRTPETTVETFLRGEWRRSKTFLFGEPFSFVSGPDAGVSKLAVLRLGGNWTWRADGHVLAARSVFNIGLPIFGATDHSGDIPDGKFFSWLGQVQWAERLPNFWDVQILARADVQLSDRPLLGIEQFAVGGHATVRGYRENRLVRDNGLVGSLEIRVPVPFPSWGGWQPHFALTPFFDAGYSWNTDRMEIGATTLLSAGIGGRLAINENILVDVNWGKALNDVETVGDDLQDNGLHIGASYTW